MKKAELKEAFKDSLPVLAGYLVLGAGFGILLQSHGYNVWWALVMSVTIFAGSGQYLAVDLLTQAESLVTAALMTFMINARHFFYGLSMLERYKDTKPYKPYLIFGLTDETYSIACSKTFAEGMSPKKYYFYLTVLDHLYWIVGSVAGALAGSLINFNSKGIEFSMTALFTVIFVQQWTSEKRHAPAIIGVACSAVCLLIFGPDSFIIPSMIAIAAVLLVGKKRLEGVREDG